MGVRPSLTHWPTICARASRPAARASRRCPRARSNAPSELDDGSTWKVRIEIGEDSFTVDLRDNPDQGRNPFNLSRDGAVIAAQLLFKAVTGPHTSCNGGSFRPLTVKTRPGSVFEPVMPAPHGYYSETRIRLFDLLWHCLAEAMPDRMPAGHFASICSTGLTGIHPDTGRPYAIIEPQVGGWGATPDCDGINANFCGIHGDTFNCPAEIAEARYGVQIERLGLNGHDGGEGRYRGGRGIEAEWRIRAPEAFLSVGYGRTPIPTWGLAQGRNGTANYVEIFYAPTEPGSVCPPPLTVRCAGATSSASSPPMAAAMAIRTRGRRPISRPICGTAISARRRRGMLTGRRVADLGSALGHRHVEQGPADAFVHQQPTLPLQSAAIAGERRIGADDAVTGHDDRDRVGAIGQAHRAHRLGLPDAGRQRAIADRAAARDAAQFVPYRALEVGAVGGGLDIVDPVEPALEIGLERRFGGGRLRRVYESNLLIAIVPLQQRQHARLVVAPIGGPNAILLIRHDQHRAGGCVEPLEKERLRGHAANSDHGSIIDRLALISDLAIFGPDHRRVPKK